MEIAAAIGRHMNGYKVIINKSTVPVGTAELVRDIINKNQSEKFPFDIVSNLEFSRSGLPSKTLKIRTGSFFKI